MKSRRKLRYRSTLEAYLDGLRTIVWFYYIKEWISLNRTQSHLKFIMDDEIYKAIRTEPNNFHDYRNGIHVPNDTKLISAEENVPNSSNVFSHGPSKTNLWRALSPLTEMDVFSDEFSKSLHYDDEIIAIRDFNNKTGFSKADDTSLSEKERKAFSSTSLFFIAFSLERLEKQMTPWQEIIYKIIVFRYYQLDNSHPEQKVNLQDLLNRTNNNKLLRWLELEKVIYKHYSIFQKTGLRVTDIAWILLADNAPYSSQNKPNITKIRNNDFSKKYQEVFENVYNISDCHD